MAFGNRPHRRFNPLLREWVLVSPQRTQRPWLGKIASEQQSSKLAYDPNCYLCPGNVRAGGERNPEYASTFVFENDYPALLPVVDSGQDVNQSGLIVAKQEAGICRVICFSPRHDLSIPLMKDGAIRQVINVWVEQLTELANTPWVHHVQIFENRGSLMGASNPHPHCQIWANATVPELPSRELQSQSDYHAQHKRCLLCDYLALEMKLEQRVVCKNDDFTAVVPYWAVWPFELLILSNRHLGEMRDLSPDEKDSLADILKRVTTRYDNIFWTPFPYSMGFHQNPTNSPAQPGVHFHAHYFPPLLRSASVQKFMVGYELLCNPQRDLTPEDAAGTLRSASEVHYLLA